MKKVFIVVIALVTAIIFCLDAVPVTSKAMALPKVKEIRVILAYHPDYLEQAPHILAAYESVLQEEGVPLERVDVFQLVTRNTDELIEEVPVIILPDNVLQNVPEQANDWIKKYLGKGGNVAVIYDAGIKHEAGHYLNRSVFADIVGLNYITYGTKGGASYETGQIKYSSEASRDFFQMPMGKTVDGLTLSSYNYGALRYPLAKNEPVQDIPVGSVYAYAVTEKKEEFPAIVLKDYGQGKVLYVNMPLGYLKANTDDLPLRSMLRTFLFDVVGIPHVMNVEQGRGAIVINWHVDSKVELISLPVLKKAGYLREGIAASYHITAGEFFIEPGDREGFDAGGKGASLTKMLMNYGTIGSHGGWGHNWFANNIITGKFKEKEIHEYIAKNNECLEKIVGYKILEYSAPVGVHPQPVATKVLEDLGVIAYYYTGDTGSAPNRVFLDGKMISDKVIAFPIMPFGSSASLWDMRSKDKRKDNEITEWLNNTLDYVERNRTVRLVYSHPYNIKNYPQAVEGFLDKIETMQANGKIASLSMSDYAKFLLRFLKTSYAFHLNEKQLVVSLKNPEGLTGITVALPKEKYREPVAHDIMVQEDERYYYITVVGPNEQEKDILFDIK